MTIDGPQNQVLHGKDNWLFLKNDTNHVLDQVTGKLLLNPRQQIYWRNLILQRSLIFQYFKIDYRFIVPPNKEVVCWRYLPDAVKVSPIRPITQILSSLDSFTRKHIFYKDEYMEIDGLYPKGETHWCDRFAYDYFFEAMKGNSSIEKTAIESYEYLPNWFDLGSKTKANYSESIEKLRPINPKSRLVFSNNAVNMGRVDIYENENQSLPVALIFRDSFFSNLLELVAESFSKVIYVWHPWIDWEMVEIYKPNLVITSTVERFLVTLPDDIGGPSWQMISTSKNLNP